MNLLTAFSLFLTKTFINKVITVETNRRIEAHNLDFGEFLGFSGIWLLTTENPVTNLAEYLSKNLIDIFSGY